MSVSKEKPAPGFRYLHDDSVMLKLTQEERAKGLLSLSLADFKGLRQVKDLSRQRTSLSGIYLFLCLKGSVVAFEI